MSLTKLVEKNRQQILDKWFDLILESYPPDSFNFFKNEKNQFQNPVGNTLSKEIAGLLDCLLSDKFDDSVTRCLDNIVRIRLVQDFTPSRAMAFFLPLKQVLREVLEEELSKNGIFEDYLAFEKKIDHLTLLGFDAYMKCKEKIYDIRAREARRQVQKLLERSGVSFDNFGDGEDPHDNNS